MGIDLWLPFHKHNYFHTLCGLRGSNICKFVQRTFAIFAMHFIVFYDMKSKHFSTALRYSSLYVISSIRQPVAQELDKIHVLYARKFCTLLRLNLCWCTSEACKYKNAITMVATMTTVTTAMLTAKGTHKTSRFLQALLHESFTSKWWFLFKIETSNFIENELLKFFNSTKINLCICRLKSEHIISKKPQKNAIFMDDASITGGIK